jgi:hypothetical protein
MLYFTFFLFERNSFMTTSNNNGRALEAKLVDVLYQENPTISLVGTTQQDQQRDLAYFAALPQAQHSFLRTLQLGMRMSYLSEVFRPSKG